MHLPHFDLNFRAVTTLPSPLEPTMSKKPVRVAVTGAAGQIGYARSSAIHSTKNCVRALTFCWYSVCSIHGARAP